MPKQRRSAKIVVDGRHMSVVRTTSAELFLLLPAPAGTRKVPKGQSAKTLLPRLGKALSRPAIDRESVFRSNIGRTRTVYAYSMDPSNPEQLVREDAKGNRAIGRMVNGRFKPVRV